MAATLSVFLLTYVLGLVNAGIGQGCMKDDIETMTHLDLDRVMGTWYEVAWIPPYFDVNNDWIWDNYYELWTLNSQRDKVEYTGFGRDPNTYKCDYYMSERTISEDPSKWYRTQTVNGTTKQVDHWILDTNYDEYLVAYGCTRADDTGMCQDAHLWIWSRTPVSSWTVDDLTYIYGMACIWPQDITVMKQDNQCSSFQTAGSSRLTQGWILATSLLVLLHL